MPMDFSPAFKMTEMDGTQPAKNQADVLLKTIVLLDGKMHQKLSESKLNIDLIETLTNSRLQSNNLVTVLSLKPKLIFKLNKQTSNP